MTSSSGGTPTSATPTLGGLLQGLDLGAIETPAFVIDMGALERNLRVLDDAQKRSGATILLALKGFAAWSTFPLVRRYLPGIAASSPDEARLGREEHGGQVHTYAPAYSERDLRACLALSNHLVFNSLSQWARFRDLCLKEFPGVRYGLRINPEHSEVEVPLYDPCAPGSRLGVTRAQLREALLGGITGLHFHTLCELGSDALERTLAAVEAKFGDLLPRMEWVNFGGGHHITREGYDIDRLVRIVTAFRERYDVEVILEPGEAIGLGTGVLVASVLDIVENGGVRIAILDTSATAHMPDTLEMPYRPQIVGGADPDALPHRYRLGGLTCLAGDVIGDWSFAEPLEIGSKLIFLDMAHYTMVKTTNFNGVRLPDIALYDPTEQRYRVAKHFGYETYRDRLS